MSPVQHLSLMFLVVVVAVAVPMAMPIAMFITFISIFSFTLVSQTESVLIHGSSSTHLGHPRILHPNLPLRHNAHQTHDHHRDRVDHGGLRDHVCRGDLHGRACRAGLHGHGDRAVRRDRGDHEHHGRRLLRLREDRGDLHGRGGHLGHVGRDGLRAREDHGDQRALRVGHEDRRRLPFPRTHGAPAAYHDQTRVSP